MIAQAIGDDLILDISPNDTMYEGNPDYYYSVGQSAMDGIALALRSAGKSAADINRVLDLPCGHGRVLRHLRWAYPEAAIVACDLDRDGVDYCAATFGAVPVYSADDPTLLPIEPGSFDLIWVGSLFTHFDATQWALFLGFFESCLRPGGVLVFSAHGRQASQLLATTPGAYSLPAPSRAHVLQSYDRTGFGYADYPNQRGYGLSMSHPSWVLGELVRHPELRLVHYAERAWADHHDLVAAVREPSWRNGPVSSPAAAAEVLGPADLDALEPARGYIVDVGAGDGALTISGWMFHPTEPITDLRVYLNNELVAEEPVGDRPDVGQYFPSIRHAGASGVNIRVPQSRSNPARTGTVDIVGCAAGRPRARMRTLFRTDLDTAVPTPPPDLMQRVSGTRDARFFKTWGLKCYGDFQEVLGRHGAPGRGDRLLDWGCGCGRLAAHFLDDPAGPEVYGCDVDGEAVAWCERVLHPGRFQMIPPHPPTAYPDGRFHYVIGYSVFTHLSRDVQLAWIRELRRIMAPGGVLVVTVNGESGALFDTQVRPRMAELRAVGIIDDYPDTILGQIVPPGYYRATFQTEEYTRREWGRYFDIVEYTVRGIGNHSDAVVMRRPA